MREARDEAKKEIEEYRVRKEAEYKAFEAEVFALPTRWVGPELTAAAHTRKQAGRG